MDAEPTVDAGPCTVKIEVYDAYAFGADSDHVAESPRAAAAGRAHQPRRGLDRGCREPPFGQATFAEQGAALALFTRVGTPIAGATITRQSESAPVVDDYYFADTGAAITTLVPSPEACTPGPDCQPVTGPNGVALLVNSPYESHYGEGQLPGDCLWHPTHAASFPGVLWVTPIDAVVPTPYYSYVECTW